MDVSKLNDASSVFVNVDYRGGYMTNFSAENKNLPSNSIKSFIWRKRICYINILCIEIKNIKSFYELTQNPNRYNLVQKTII